MHSVEPGGMLSAAQASELRPLSKGAGFAAASDATRLQGRAVKVLCSGNLAANTQPCSSRLPTRQMFSWVCTS